ncbi:MAG: hypothetical protein LUI12_07685 [Clostridiales bacterium]|nr:hypothetical protein [Clostridiales bacterium]
MKRKLAVLLTLTLSAALLGGCGGGSSTGSSSAWGSSKTKTLSEYLSKEDTICYWVSSVDKGVTPHNIYFFQDGTLTVIPGDEFGLTMGDFAQMTDKEIWETYETVRETYAEEYKAEKLESVEKDLKNSVQDLEYWIEDGIFMAASLGDNEDNAMYEIEMYASQLYAIYDLDSSELDLSKLEDAIAFMEQEAEQLKAAGVYDEELDGYFEDVRELMATVAAGNVCVGPFYDQTVYFAITTDSSGNNVQDERIVWTTDADAFDTIPTSYYTSIELSNAESVDREIYDSSYNCFTIKAGSKDSMFCTRDSMTLDTVDSQNVLLDPDSEELNALFESEVLARYE